MKTRNGHLLIIIFGLTLSFCFIAIVVFNNAAWPYVDLVVPLQTAPPRLQFHAGEVGKDGQPLLLPALPAIPGPASSWYVAQWQQSYFLTPQRLQTLHVGKFAHWRFDAPDSHSSLMIDPTSEGYAYTLSERDGLLTTGGGANLFLATKVLVQPSDFAAPVELRVRTQIVDATISYGTRSAEATGAVQAMAFIGLGLMFHGPKPTTDRFVFMQIPITVSRSVPPGPRTMCDPASGTPNLLYAAETDWSPFRPQAPVDERHYNLSKIVQTMLSKPYPCAGRLLSWPIAQQNLAAWHLTGLYIGLEVQNRDTRLGTSGLGPQGHAYMALKITAVSVRRHL